MVDEYWVINFTSIEPQAKLIANEYLKYLKLRNKSQNTIDTYRRILEIFLTQNYKPLNELESNDVLLWLRTEHKDKSKNTISGNISALSNFFQFCLTEEYINKQLIKKRWRPKITSTLPKYLDHYEQARLKIISENLSKRNRAIIEFLLSSGCRKSEVVALDIEDIDLDNRTAKVVGKGKKIREVHFSIECSLLIKEYFKERKSENHALFVTRTGKRIIKDEVYRITTNLGKKTGLSYSLNPHRFRHTFASNMLAKGADIQFIGDELGHTDLNTTRIYARIPSQEIIDEYNKKMGGI